MQLGVGATGFGGWWGSKTGEEGAKSCLWILGLFMAQPWFCALGSILIQSRVAGDPVSIEHHGELTSHGRGPEGWVG